MSNSFYILALFLSLFITLSTSTSKHDPNYNLKSLHITLYQHATINTTDFLKVQGIPLPGLNSALSAPIGTMMVLREPITLKPDPSSELVGFLEGASITSSFDGLDNLSVGKITLTNLKGYKGSISTLGSVHTINPSDVPVVGGTGDFLFIQGFMTASLFDAKGLSFVYKLEVHLYWPPYAGLIY